MGCSGLADELLMPALQQALPVGCNTKKTLMFKKLFGNSSSPSEPIIPKENFTIFKLTIADGLALATINTGYNNYPNKKFYPWYATILMEIGDKNENGHPTNEEAELLNSLEDRITEFLGQTQIVHRIGRVTRNGERDIIYYIDKPAFHQDKTKEFFDSINSVRAVNLTIEKDKRWDNVAAFIQ